MLDRRSSLWLIVFIGVVLPEEPEGVSMWLYYLLHISVLPSPRDCITFSSPQYLLPLSRGLFNLSVSWMTSGWSSTSVSPGWLQAGLQPRCLLWAWTQQQQQFVILVKRLFCLRWEWFASPDGDLTRSHRAPPQRNRQSARRQTDTTSTDSVNVDVQYTLQTLHTTYKEWGVQRPRLSAESMTLGETAPWEKRWPL